MRRRIIILPGVTLLSLLLFYPFYVTVVPDWNVQVVDEAQKPVGSAYVELFATQWTLDFNHEEAVCTGSNGYAHFSREAIRASVISRMLRWLSKIGPHSSLGPDVKIGVEALGYGDMRGDSITEDWDGSSSRVSSQLRMHKCPSGLTGYRCSFDYKYFFTVNSSAGRMKDCQNAPGHRFADPTP